MSARARWCAAMALLAVVACDQHEQVLVRPGSDGQLVVIVEPAEVVVAKGQPKGEDCCRAKLIASADGGTETDVTNQVTWTATPQNVAEFASPGNLAISGQAGGVVTVAATLGQRFATAKVTVKLVSAYPMRASDPPPGSNAEAPFSQPLDAALQPTIVYPNRDVVVPANLGRLELHFIPPPNTTQMRITLSGAAIEQRIYGTCEPLANGCVYELRGDVWRELATAARGTGPVTVEVAAAGSGRHGVSDTQTLTIADDELTGVAYYYTTSNASAIMSWDSSTPDVAPQPVLTAATASGCIGCHVVSSDGRSLIAGWNNQNNVLRMLRYDLASKTVAVPKFDGQATSLALSPDGQWLAAPFTAQSQKPELPLYDPTSGGSRGAIQTGTLVPTHPDWSPDGKQLVFTARDPAVFVPEAFNVAYHGAIGIVDRASQSPRVLVEAAPDKNRYFPVFSPDGSFVVFNESTCPMGDLMSSDCDSARDPSAQLWLVDAAVGATPRPLARACQPGVADRTIDGAAIVSSEHARFYPSKQGRRTWIAFNSYRRYGLRQQAPSVDPNTTPYGSRIWIAAIDHDANVGGGDPSWPAFVFPYQDLTTSNLRLVWVRRP